MSKTNLKIVEMAELPHILTLGTNDILLFRYGGLYGYGLICSSDAVATIKTVLHKIGVGKPNIVDLSRDLFEFYLINATSDNAALLYINRALES